MANGTDSQYQRSKTGALKAVQNNPWTVIPIGATVFLVVGLFGALSFIESHYVTVDRFNGFVELTTERHRELVKKLDRIEEHLRK